MVPCEVPPWTLQPVNTRESTWNTGARQARLGAPSPNYQESQDRLWSQGHISCATNPKPLRSPSKAERAKQNAAEACS